MSLNSADLSSLTKQTQRQRSVTSSRKTLKALWSMRIFSCTSCKAFKNLNKIAWSKCNNKCNSKWCSSSSITITCHSTTTTLAKKLITNTQAITITHSNLNISNLINNPTVINNSTTHSNIIIIKIQIIKNSLKKQPKAQRSGNITENIGSQRTKSMAKIEIPRIKKMIEEIGKKREEKIKGLETKIKKIEEIMMIEINCNQRLEKNKKNKKKMIKKNWTETKRKRNMKKQKKLKKTKTTKILTKSKNTKKKNIIKIRIKMVKLNTSQRTNRIQMKQEK